jgi:hypothetical protein
MRSTPPKRAILTRLRSRSKALEGAVFWRLSREMTAAHGGPYTVRFSDAIYVLHAFQKKSKSGIATPKKDIDLIKQRLHDAQHAHRQKQN